MIRTALTGRFPDRVLFARTADGLVVAAMVSLPWSTTVTGVLILLWLIALLPTLDAPSLRQTIITPAGGLPALLCALALFGMLWSEAPPEERFGGFQAFLRLLAIPLLLLQFRRFGQHGWLVLGGFLVSCTALLLLSWVTTLWPWMWWPTATPGVPVKDYVVQSGEFVLCAFGLTHWAIESWRQHRRLLAWTLAALALAFLANIVFVATARAALVVFAVLLVVLALQRFSWKGVLAVAIAGVILSGAAWMSSPYLRGRVLAVSEEIDRYESAGALTSSGYRLAWWKKSLEFIAAAPIVGHGTGATREMFRNAAAQDPSLQPAVTDNPHNQTLSIAIQLGLVGVALLYGMWMAHLLLFRGPGLTAWIGAALVIQNIVGSVFNSQIFYFTPGWLYVIGVGALGGMVLARNRAAAARPPA